MMKRTQIYISEATHQAAKTLAQCQNKTLAGLFREFVTEGIQKERKKTNPALLKRLGELGLTGGPKDLSANMDKYLYQK